MITMRMNMKRLVTVVLLFTIHCSLFTTTAQTVKNGSRWWDGKRLYTATVDDGGNVTMNGESKDMGGDTFLLNKVRDGRYTIAADNEYGWLSIRGQVGWTVDYIQEQGLNFLVVRNPYDDCVYTLTLTPDDLNTCLAQQKQDEEREVSWMLQNRVLDIHYLGHFSKPQLRLLRNEILARHGWRFQSKDLQEHFGKQAWYKPVADNKTITLGLIETTNLQLLKTEEAVDDDNRVRYERVEEAPEMAKAVDGVITVTTEEQLLNALGNNRTIEIGEDVHLNLSRVLEQEDKFSGIPGRSWVTIAKRGGQEPTIVSDYCGDGQQLTLKNFEYLTIRGKKNSSIEVDPRYAFCLNFMDCNDCCVENLTIGHTEGGYCDGGVIGFTGGSENTIRDCDLYGCGTYGLVTHETWHLSISRTSVHDCTYGIMELYDSNDIRFEDCDFFSNREYELISNNSQNVEFRGCRFFANWADAPLFQSAEDIMLYGCEIHHPNIGARTRLITPDNDCTFGDEAAFVPKPRKKAIGPDAN